MSHTFTKLLTHVIFSTKERRSLMDDELQVRLFPYLGGIVREMGGTPLTINGPSTHVHLLVQTKASVSIAKLVETVKSSSTSWVHREWKERWKFAWQEGYGAFSVGPVQVPEVIKYIAGQKEHHRKISFQEEFISFLQKYGIEYDERYIWK
jgi:REP element-mobilizing transposase RayT